MSRRSLLSERRDVRTLISGLKYEIEFDLTCTTFKESFKTYKLGC